MFYQKYSGFCQVLIMGNLQSSKCLNNELIFCHSCVFILVVLLRFTYLLLAEYMIYRFRYFFLTTDWRKSSSHIWEFEQQAEAIETPAWTLLVSTCTVLSACLWKAGHFHMDQDYIKARSRGPLLRHHSYSRQCDFAHFSLLIQFVFWAAFSLYFWCITSIITAILC